MHLIRRTSVADSSWTAHVLLLVVLLIFEAKWIVGDQFGEIAQPAEGDNCVLRSGETGVCRRPESCEWLPQPIVHHRSLENSDNCGFNGTEVMVCCPPSNLVHGLDGYEAEVPFIAALGFKRENPNESSFTWFCGSSLITSRFLLTTAHCTRYTDKPLIARMGTSNLLEAKQENNFIQDRNVKRIFRHPSYRALTKDNDIALVEVDHPFIFNEKVTATCLSTAQQDRDETEQLYTTGWGAVEIRNKLPEKLYRVNFTTVPIDKCREQYKLLQSILRTYTIHNTQYCAIRKPTNDTVITTPCNGDSGGPLYYESDTSDGPKYTLVGIISTGINCGGKFPGVFVRVSSYLDWIASVVGPLEV